MGLDNFWELPPEGEEAKFDPPLNLCGGMLSSNGEGSFRGKVYDSLIEAVTGESLYQEGIEAEIVSKMATVLSGTDFEDLPEHFRGREGDVCSNGEGEVTKQEYEDLRRMFSAYANLGAGLKGWW